MAAAGSGRSTILRSPASGRRSCGRSGRSVVAVGTRGDELVPTVWVLEPESAWIAETVSVEPGVRLTDVALIGDRLLVVGSAPAADGTPAAAAWTRSDPAP